MSNIHCCLSFITKLGSKCFWTWLHNHSSSELLNRIEHGFLHNVWNLASFWDTLYNIITIHSPLFLLSRPKRYTMDPNWVWRCLTRMSVNLTRLPLMKARSIHRYSPLVPTKERRRQACPSEPREKCENRLPSFTVFNTLYNTSMLFCLQNPCPVSNTIKGSWERGWSMEMIKM